MHDQESDQRRTVVVLAEKFQAPVDDVAALCERERAELARGARVTTFFQVFAARTVRDALRKRSTDEQASMSGCATLSIG
jgi:Protein of unknown function (DUF3562)